MARLAAEGIRADALSFSTSRTLNHKTPAGESIPTLAAAEDELATIATAMGATSAGWSQVIDDLDEQLPAEFAMLHRLAAASGGPMNEHIAWPG
jgi:N-acyl-D-aspartate/D-glutamate deacylase